MQRTFFDVENRLDDLSKIGDPLEKLNALVPWEEFRAKLSLIRAEKTPSTAGRPGFDVLLMFKILVLQSLYNLSDDGIEYQISDRLSFIRFLGLSLSDKVPDAKTIWLFREQLSKAGLVHEVFVLFDSYLRANGFIAQKGQIVDASIVSVPKQRNSRDENELIKQGESPLEKWSDSKARQKDVDARWTKKNGKSYFGYKNHIQVDVKHKFIRAYGVTPVSVHDSQVFLELLDPDNTNGNVYADSAYSSEEYKKSLKDNGYRPHLQRKGCRNKPLTEWEKQGNRTRSKVRSRVEHVFGVQLQRAGTLILRTIGIVRANAKIGLRNLAYNLDRFATLRLNMA